jgi:hypothetical protein
MHSSSAEPGELKNIAIGGAFLTGIFVTITVLIFTVLLVPKLFAPVPIYPILWLFGLAIIVSIYDIFAHRLHLPIVVHALLFIIMQWLGLWGWIWVVTKTRPPFIFNPSAAIKIHWQWFLVLTILWVVTIFLIEILARLSRIPKETRVTDNMAKWYTEIKVDLVPWEHAWRGWRFSVILVMLITVLGLALSFSYLKVDRFLNLLITGLLLIQLLMGFVLIAVGFFYLKRAFWKTDNLEPDLNFKTVWRRGMTPLLAGLTIFGLIMPVNFKALDKWWLISLVNWLLKFFWKMPVNQANPLTRLEGLGTAFTHLNNTKPSILMQIIQLVVMILGGLIILMVPLVILAFIMAMIGLIFSKIFGGEINRLKGLRGALIKIYLFWLNLWRKRRSRSWFFFSKRDQQSDIKNEVESQKKVAKNKPHFWGRGSQAIIRRGYYRLIGIARTHGFHWQPTQTPQDIASELTGLLPDEKGSITEVTENYQLARYGLKEPPIEKVTLFERIRRTLQRRLRLFRRGM